jgi:hypothetical protein
MHLFPPDSEDIKKTAFSSKFGNIVKILELIERHEEGY